MIYCSTGFNSPLSNAEGWSSLNIQFPARNTCHDCWNMVVYHLYKHKLEDFFLLFFSWSYLFAVNCLKKIQFCVIFQVIWSVSRWDPSIAPFTRGFTAKWQGRPQCCSLLQLCMLRPGHHFSPTLWSKGCKMWPLAPRPSLCMGLRCLEDLLFSTLSLFITESSVSMEGVTFYCSGAFHWMHCV